MHLAPSLATTGGALGATCVPRTWRPHAAPRKGTRGVPHSHQAKFDTWVFDCDGTLWKGDTLIDGVAEALELLRSRVRRGCVAFEGASLTHPTLLTQTHVLFVLRARRSCL
jgi:hypothetical protein